MFQLMFWHREGCWQQTGMPVAAADVADAIASQEAHLRQINYPTVQVKAEEIR